MDPDDEQQRIRNATDAMSEADHMAYEPKFWCLRCGARWSMPMVIVTHEGPMAGPFTSGCPGCGSEVRNMAPPRELIVVDLATAIREADLTEDELRDVANALHDKESSGSPRAFAQRFPKTSAMVTAAARISTKRWARVLAVAVAAAMPTAVSVVAVDQAHRDAIKAIEHSDEQAKLARRTSQMSAEDAERVKRAVLEELRADEPSPSDRTSPGRSAGTK